jgi:hypothetical protein
MHTFIIRCASKWETSMEKKRVHLVPFFVKCSLGVIVNAEFTFQELHGTFLILTFPGFEFAIQAEPLCDDWLLHSVSFVPYRGWNNYVNNMPSFLYLNIIPSSFRKEQFFLCHVGCRSAIRWRHLHTTNRPQVSTLSKC